jgi:DNA-binding transcriptional LysR family regulator
MATGTDLTTHQLEYFVAVAEERQFTRAAERLHVAQPSISSQIRRLEQILGTPLFYRGPGPLRLTDTGKELLPLARRVLKDLGEVVHGVSEVEGLRRGHVAIGATPSLGAALLPAVLARFHRRYPGVSLAVTERASQDLVEGLESGILDLALGIMPFCQPMFERVLLAIEELVVVTAVDHQLGARRRIAISDLRDVPMIMFHEGYELRSTTLAAFDQAGFAPSVALEGVEMSSVLSMVAADLGAAIVPSIVAAREAGVHVLRLHSPRLEREIALLRRQDHAQSRAAAALSAEITTFLTQSGWPGQVPLGLKLLLD